MPPAPSLATLSLVPLCCVQVLDTYSFAIAELEVNAHCVCNGHASLCTRESGWRCECEHGTEGDSCERCSGFLQDRPWAAASLSQASTCQRKGTVDTLTSTPPTLIPNPSLAPPPTCSVPVLQPLGCMCL